MCRHSRFKGACHHLLGNLPALEEVYLLDFRSKYLQITESTGMLGHTEKLRAAVLHTQESAVRVSSLTMPSQPIAVLIYHCHLYRRMMSKFCQAHVDEAIRQAEMQ